MLFECTQGHIEDVTEAVKKAYEEAKKKIGPLGVNSLEGDNSVRVVVYCSQLHEKTFAVTQNDFA